MHEHKGMISIWFFIGVLLLFYGVVILGQGLYELSVPPARVVILPELRIGIWWGVLLLIMGAGYSFYFRPNKDKK